MCRHIRRCSSNSEPCEHLMMGPLVIVAGKEYGTGSSRDWAAKGTKLLQIAPWLPKALSAFTAPIWSVWVSFRWS